MFLIYTRGNAIFVDAASGRGVTLSTTAGQ